VQERRIIQGAFAASLLLHLVLAAATWRIPLFPEIDPAALAAPDDAVEVFLMPAEDQSAHNMELPRKYTEIPDRLASETPPDQAEYLAMHHALAADNVLGGDADQPSAEKEWISDQVQIRKEDLAGDPGIQTTDAVPPSPPPSSGARQDDPTTGTAENAPRETMSDDARGEGTWALAEPRPGQQEARDSDRQSRTGDPQAPTSELDRWWRQEQPSILKQGRQGSDGDRGFDFDQAAKGKVTSGVAVDGDFSLNTYEWDYAPWMHRFTNELYRHWVPPYAYRLGILQGHTVIKLVVRKDGTVASLDVQETEGHESLHEASEAALRAFAPYAPLPPTFPEENLVIILGLYYPALQR